MSLDDEFRCCGFKAYTPLDTDDSVAHVGITANGIGGTNFLYLLDGFHAVGELLAVDTNDFALVELNLQQ